MSKPFAAPWLEIRADMLRRVHSGEWPPGGHIPHEAALAVAYGCTRSTISRALRDLAEAGFLERRRKGGTRVAEKPVRRAVLDIPLIEQGIAQQGHAYGYRLHRAGLVPAPGFVAEVLEMAPGLPVLEVCALHLADGHPHQFEHRWIDPRTAAGVEHADFSRAGPDIWLLHHAPLSRLEMTLRALPAEGAAAAALGVAPGTPLLEAERRSFTLTAPIGLLRLLHHPSFCLKARL